MPRRGENIYKRKDGRWEGRYIADRKPDGKAVYRSIYGTSYAQVRERLVAKRQETHKRQMDIKSLSEILGHANVQTTLQMYVHPSMASKRAAMEAASMLAGIA